MFLSPWLSIFIVKICAVSVYICPMLPRKKDIYLHVRRFVSRPIHISISLPVALEEKNGRGEDILDFLSKSLTAAVVEML